MSGRKKWLIALTAVFVPAVVTVSVWPRENEPEYQGRKLSEWLERCQYGGGHFLVDETPEHEQAVDAVRAIGTNATPFLVKWAARDVPWWRELTLYTIWRFGAVRSFPRLVQWVRQDRKMSLAYVGFSLLADQSDCAIPELRKLMTKGGSERVRSRAVLALESLGPEGIRAVEEVVTNKAADPKARISGLSSWSIYGVPTNVSIPAARLCLTDPDLRVRKEASNVFSLTGYETALTNRVNGDGVSGGNGK